MLLTHEFRRDLLTALSNYHKDITVKSIVVTEAESCVYVTLLDILRSIEESLELKEKMIEACHPLRRTLFEEFFDTKNDNLLRKKMMSVLQDPRYSHHLLLRAQIKEAKELALQNEGVQQLRDENSQLLSRFNELETRWRDAQEALEAEKKRTATLENELTHLRSERAMIYSHTPVSYVPEGTHRQTQLELQEAQHQLQLLRAQNEELHTANHKLEIHCQEAESALQALKAKSEQHQLKQQEFFLTNLGLIQENRDLRKKLQGVNESQSSENSTTVIRHRLG